MADPILTGFPSIADGVTFLENTVNAGPVVIDSSVDFSNDADNFDGGTLTLQFGKPEDIWSINNEGNDEGDIAFDGTTVSWSGNAIGTATGGDGTDLVITFNATATAAAIEHLIENLTYQTLSDSPTISRTARLLITDADGDSVSEYFTLVVTPENDPVEIVSNGGGDTAHVSTKEGSTGATKVKAEDPDLGAVIGFSIEGGDDALLFDIDPATGELTFKSAPDHDAPTDADTDNVYEVKVRATSGVDTDDQTIFVKVLELVEGTKKNDKIKGGKEAEIIDAGEGDDKIDAGDGDDQIDAGKGNDKVDGGKGNDLIDAGEGNDKVEGGKGNDLIEGGKGKDFLRGNGGNDTIEGGSGKDDISGGKGEDDIKGGNKNDKLNGGADKDRLDGGEGKDILKGGKGNDVLIGGKDKDTLIGGKGNDSYVFNELGKKHQKVIKDFETNKDKISIDSTVFKAVPQDELEAALHYGKKAQTKDEHLLYEKKTGILRYDVDGEGGKDAIVMAKLENKAKLTDDDLVVI